MNALLRRNRAALEHAILALVLPFVAGAINASGFFAIGTYTSHVTGNVARIGHEAALGHGRLVARCIGFLGSFLFGAMVATALVIWSRSREEPRYFRGLLLEAGMLTVFASVSVNAAHPRAYLNDFVLTSLLCFSMGLQNAMVTKLSGARIRTTHLTGVTTDIGIQSVRLMYAWRDRRGEPPRQIFRDLWHTHDFVHLRLHASIWLSFLLGAMAGPLGYVRFGHFALLLPCVILVLLAGYDVAVGLTESQHRAFAPIPLQPLA